MMQGRTEKADGSNKRQEEEVRTEKEEPAK